MTTKKTAMKVFIEGVDGTGKTTLANNVVGVLNDILDDYNIYYLREPGGSERAEEVRKKIMNEELTKEEEIGLFAEARAIMYEDNKELFENPKNIIIFDRSLLSSVVYQTDELTKEKIKKILAANNEFIQQFGYYDLGVLLEVASLSEEKKKEIYMRTMNEGKERNRLDPEDIEAYDTLAQKYLTAFTGIKMFLSGVVISAHNSIEENTFFLAESIIEELKERDVLEGIEDKTILEKLEKMANEVFGQEKEDEND